MIEQRNVLDILLSSDIPKIQTKQFRVSRLSEACGQDVILELKGISYSQISAIRKRDEFDVHTVLNGVVSPDLKSPDLLEKYNAPTPAELVKNMFLPGEISEISRIIEKLSGYRVNTLEEVKKN